MSESALSTGPPHGSTLKAWWRPRFTVRTLFLILTLVCAYFGAWEATKKYGVPVEVHHRVNTLADSVSLPKPDASSPMPFVITQTWVRVTQSGPISEAREYYVWFFGCERRLVMVRNVRQASPYDLLLLINAEQQNSR